MCPTNDSSPPGLYEVFFCVFILCVPSTNVLLALLFIISKTDFFSKYGRSRNHSKRWKTFVLWWFLITITTFRYEKVLVVPSCCSSSYVSSFSLIPLKIIPIIFYAVLSMYFAFRDVSRCGWFLSFSLTFVLLFFSVFRSFGYSSFFVVIFPLTLILLFFFLLFLVPLDRLSHPIP